MVRQTRFHGTDLSLPNPSFPHAPAASSATAAAASGAASTSSSAAAAAASGTNSSPPYEPVDPSLLTKHHISCVATAVTDSAEFGDPAAQELLAFLEEVHCDKPVPQQLWYALCHPGALLEGPYLLGGLPVVCIAANNP